MKKGKIAIIVFVVLAVIYFFGNRSSTRQTPVSATTAPAAAVTQVIAQATAAPTKAPTNTEAPVSRGSYRDEYNAIAKYQMSELQSNTRKFRRTAEAGGCYIEFNNYRDTTGYYEIVVNAKSTKKEDAPVFLQVAQDMIKTVVPSVTKDQLNKVSTAIKNEKSLEDYALTDSISVTYHRPISWSSGYIAIKIQ